MGRVITSAILGLLLSTIWRSTAEASAEPSDFLIKDGITACVIAYSSTYTSEPAARLQYFLYRAAGLVSYQETGLTEKKEEEDAIPAERRIPLLEASALPAGESRIVIHVGPTARARELKLYDALRPDTIRLKTVGRELFLLGYDEMIPEVNVRGNGTHNAVMQFAETVLGVDYLWPGEDGEIIPRRTDLALPVPLDETYQPVFRNRKIRGGDRGPEAAANAWWSFHRLVRTTYGVDTGHAFNDYWKLYRDEHPEWFAMQPDGYASFSEWFALQPDGYAIPSGKFRVGGWYTSTRHFPPQENQMDDSWTRPQRCFSNPALVQEVVGRVVDTWQAANLKPNMISIMPNDGGRATPCLCPACEAADARDSSAPQVTLRIDVPPPTWGIHFAMPSSYTELPLDRETRPWVRG